MSQLRIFGGSIVLPSAIVSDVNVASDAAVNATKLQHRYKLTSTFGLSDTDTPVAGIYDLFLADAAGTIQSFKCYLNDTGTSTDVDFDLLVNGASVLSAAVNHTNADSDGTIKSGTISSATLAADDKIQVQLTVTSSTGAQGPVAVVTIDEAAA